MTVNSTIIDTLLWPQQPRTEHTLLWPQQPRTKHTLLWPQQPRTEHTLLRPQQPRTEHTLLRPQQPRTGTHCSDSCYVRCINSTESLEACENFTKVTILLLMKRLHYRKSNVNDCNDFDYKTTYLKLLDRLTSMEMPCRRNTQTKIKTDQIYKYDNCSTTR